MKKIFSLFAAVLMAGSLMAKDATLIKFETVQPATEVAGSTYGSDGFTLEIPDTSDKAAVDANNCTFGVSDEDKIKFTHRLKTGGPSSKDGRIFTLNIPEEGPLAIYARTSTSSATDRSFLIANGADTIAYHVCLDTDTVEGASSKIFLPVIVENVPAGSYKITYNNGINFYGFQIPASWDGTVTLSKTEFRTLADLEGLTLTFNDATAVTLAEEPEYILFQNEDGSEMYAIWSPAYAGTYNVEGNVVTLNHWYAAEGETSPLPAENGAVYFEDYGTFSVDGEEAYFETVEASYIAPVPTTYTVTYTVTDFDAEHCQLKAGYFNEEGTVSGEFAAGANTVPENVYAFVNAVVVDDYTVEVKVNGAAVELIDGQWYSESVITADMTIDVTFTAPVPGPDVDPLATTYTTNVEFTAGTNSYLTDKINIGENQYDAFKIGTSKASGSCSVTLPAGTESFHFHAICWSKTADTDLKISGAYEETVVIKAANISGISPYTFDLDYADPTERYYVHKFDAPLTEAATVTFSCNYRAVFFGVNAVVKSTPTAVENIEVVKATKVMVNGQMLIIRDGKTYNVMGMQF